MGDVTGSGGASRADRAARLLQHPTSNAAEHDARRLVRQSGSDDPRVPLAEMLRRLGHSGGRVEQTVAGTRWFALCSCSWVSTTTNTETDALGALTHHARLALREWRRSGLPLSATPPAVPDWDRARRLRRHLAVKYPTTAPLEWATAESDSRGVAGDTPSRSVPAADVPHLRASGA
jgi:hypothetical protein